MTDIFGDFATHGLQYRFNAGVPDQITQRITKWQQANRTRWDAFYVQDQWTRNRLTLQGALRYERAWSFFPEGLNGLLTDSVFGGPARTLPEAKGVNSYNDIAPRMGMAYDIFGNGKTAIKVNLSKYWQYAANDGVYIGTNPASTFAQTANRAWTDANRNFNPDCDLQNPLAQDNRATGGDLCGALDNQNFFRFKQDGSVTSTATRIDPALLSGWGVRPYDWQFAASVQQELMPRVAVDIGYSRRWWGNFTVTDNLAVGPADFDTYTRTSPSHPDLPDGGQPVSYQLRNLRTPFGAVDNYLTLANNYGDMTYYWQGVDMTVTARTNNDLTLQGGFTTGAGTRDQCDVWAALPETMTSVGCEPAMLTRAGSKSRGCGTGAVWSATSSRRSTCRSAPSCGHRQTSSQPTTRRRAVCHRAPNTSRRTQMSWQRSVAQSRAVARPRRWTWRSWVRSTRIASTRWTCDSRRSSASAGRAPTWASISTTCSTPTREQPSIRTYGTDGSTCLRPNAILNPRYVRFNATVDF